MKRIQLFIVAALLLTTALQAQENNGEQVSTEQRAANFVVKLNEKIHLSKIKADSITLVFKNFYEEMQTYRTDGNMEVIKLLAQRRDKKVQDILLNDDQYAAYLKLLDDMKKQRQQRREQNGSQGGGHRGGGMNRPGGMGGMRQPGF